MVGQGLGEEDYAAFLERKYGLGTGGQVCGPGSTCMHLGPGGGADPPPPLK